MLADNLGRRAGLHRWAGEFEAAVAVAREARALSLRTANVWGQSFSQMFTGLAYLELGRPDLAIGAMEESIRESEQADYILRDSLLHLPRVRAVLDGERPIKPKEISMDTLTVLREQIKRAHGYLEGTMADVTPEQAHWIPPGNAHPIGSRYAHLVVSEDTLIHAVLAGGAPLHASAWAGKTGISDPRMDSPLEWARSVKVDLPAVRQYAQAVYAATDRYLASLTPNDLSRIVDMSQFGLGQHALPMFVGTFGLGHIDNITGEISAVKGLLGLKGYVE